MQGRGGSDAVAGKGAKDGRRAKGGRHTAREEQAANQTRLEQEAEMLLSHSQSAAQHVPVLAHTGTRTNSGRMTACE